MTKCARCGFAEDLIHMPIRDDHLDPKHPGCPEMSLCMECIQVALHEAATDEQMAHIVCDGVNERKQAAFIAFEEWWEDGDPLDLPENLGVAERVLGGKLCIGFAEER